MICRPDAERDIVETPALVEVVADVVDLLFASLGLDLFGGQWRKLRNRSARRRQTPTHTHNSAQGAKVHQRICLFKLKLQRAYRDNFVEYQPFGRLELPVDQRFSQRGYFLRRI